MRPRATIRVTVALVALVAGGCSSDDESATPSSSDDDSNNGGASPCAEGLSGLVWPVAGTVIAEDIEGIVGELDRAVEALLDRTDLTVSHGDDGPSGCTFDLTSGDDRLASLHIASTAGGLELQGIAMPPDHPEGLSVSIAGSTVQLGYGRPLDCQGASELVVTYGDVTAEGELNAADVVELTLPSQPAGPGTLVVRTTDEAGRVVCLRAISVRPGDFAAG